MVIIMIENRNDFTIHDFFAVFKNKVTQPVSSQHSHDSYEINFFLNVNLEIFIKDTRYEIHDGDVIFINDFDIHRFIYDNTSTNYNRYLVNFKKDYILPSLKAAGIESVLDYLKDERYTHASTTLKERKELEALFKALIYANNSCSEEILQNYKDATLKSYLLLILMQIWKLIENNKPKSTMYKKDQLVHAIIHFIDKNYMHDINLDLLKENFFLDKFYISHIFKEVTDFSIMEYVQQRRIIEAQKMLKDPQNEIIDICFDCGFNSIQNFHKVFKKISGMTPHKYRNIRL
jgi:YesN/AraC family two-component response regulator